MFERLNPPMSADRKRTETDVDTEPPDLPAADADDLEAFEHRAAEPRRRFEDVALGLERRGEL